LRALSDPTDEFATLRERLIKIGARVIEHIARNASDEVKAQAAAVTASYNDEGFAKAMETFILDPARQ
jgi:hypothetical protein